MTNRYFKATDGELTYFRASPSRVYLSLSTGDAVGNNGWTMHWDGRGRFPAVEISRQEYKALVAQKMARLERAQAKWMADHPGRDHGYYMFKGDAPRDSWIYNDQETVS